MADLLVGMNAERASKVLAQLYQNPSIKNGLFRGSKSGNIMGLTAQISYEIVSAPSVEFRNPSAQEWANSIKATGGPGNSIPDSFILRLPIQVSLSVAGESTSTSGNAPVYCSVQSNGHNIVFQADAVGLDLQNASDNDKSAAQLIIPDILASINTMLRGINIPPASIPGVALTPPNIDVSRGVLLIAMNLANRAQAEIPAELPGQAFFVLASQDLVQTASNNLLTSQIQGQSFSQNGSEGAAGFSAEYHVGGNVTNISLNTTPNPTVLRANVSLNMNANAGINTPVGMIIDAAGNVVKSIGSTVVSVAEKIGETFNPSNW